MADNQLRIFYSWQMWTKPEKGANNNRNFIQDALNKAAKQIIHDTETHIIIDRDTKDVPGTPPIMETIMAKIDSADVYVADLSYVMQTDHRSTPNPNVMIELGYALKRLSGIRLILIMNTAHGSPEDRPLPFDFQHRRYPITYHLEPDADAETRKLVKDELVKNLAMAIKLIIEKESPIQVQVEELIQQGNTIHIEQRLGSEINRLYTALVSNEFVQQKEQILKSHPFDSHELWQAAIDHYFKFCKPSLEIFVTLAAYGNDAQATIISQAVERWIDHVSQPDKNFTVWRFLPSLLLIYTVGIIALEKQKWAYLKAIFFARKITHPAHYARRDNPFDVIVEFTSTKYTANNSWINAGYKYNEMYENSLRPLFDRYMISDRAYQQAFDFFEFLMSVHFWYSRRDSDSNRFLRPRSKINRSEQYILEQLEEWGRQGENTAILKVGLFGGSHEVFQEILLDYCQVMNRSLGPFANPLPNYQIAYKRGLDFYSKNQR